VHQVRDLGAIQENFRADRQLEMVVCDAQTGQSQILPRLKGSLVDLETRELTLSQKKQIQTTIGSC
jgi:hypothetical protein